MYRSKLGPCAPRMQHRFPRGGGTGLAHDYVAKTCINCHGTFIVNAAFTEGLRNVISTNPAQARAAATARAEAEDAEYLAALEEA